jgi:hypothetical protein
MAVVDVTQMWSRDGGSASGERTDRYYRTYTRTTAYQVLVDDPATNLNEIENAAGIPSIGDLYPGSNIVRVLRKTPVRHSPIFWQVDVEYEGDNSFTTNRPIIRKGSVTSSEPVDQDWFGRAICNANFEPVEGLSRDVTDTAITITRNFASINDDLVLDYHEATNSDVWYGYSPGRVRLVNHQAEQIFANEQTSVGYWKVTATFIARRGYRVTPDKAWYKRYRNEGLYVRVGTPPNTRIIRAVDDNKSPVTRPILLKEDGTRETNPDNAYFLHAQVYGSMPYNALGFL